LIQRTCISILLAFLLLPLGSAAWGQNAPIQARPTIQGIKIVESSFDPETKTARLVFVNARNTDITAYHYCSTVLSTSPGITGEECQLLDALRAVLQMRAEKWPPGTSLTGPGQNVVHPGERRVIEEQIGGKGVYGGSIYIDEVAWLDDTFEGPSQIIIAERTAELKERVFVSNTVKDALSSHLEPMLMASVITTLKTELQQERQHGYDKDHCGPCMEKRLTVLGDAIDSLEHPGRYTGRANEKFVPDNQSEFLTQFLVRHDSFSEETSKHVSLRKAEKQ